MFIKRRPIESYYKAGPVAYLANVWSRTSPDYLYFVEEMYGNRQLRAERRFRGGKSHLCLDDKSTLTCSVRKHSIDIH